MLAFPSPLYTYISQILLFVSLATLGIGFRSRVAMFLQGLSDQRGQSNRDLLLIGVAGGGLVGLTLLMIGLPEWVAMIGALAGAFGVPFFVKAHRYKKYVEAFEGALAESLQTVASSLRAGLTLKDALAVVADNCPEPVAGEIAMALKEYNFGLPIEDALDGIRKRVRTPNCNIAFGAMIISSQLGGRLPTMLRKIVGTIRERQRVEGKLKALTAQGRSQAFLLCSAPPVLGIGMYFYDPQKMSLLTDYWVGQIFLCIAIVLEIIGIVVTQKVMRLEV